MIGEIHTPDYTFRAHPIEREGWDALWKRTTMQVIGFRVTVDIRREGIRYVLTESEHERLLGLSADDLENREGELHAFVARLRRRDPDDYFIPEGAVIKSINFEVGR